MYVMLHRFQETWRQKEKLNLVSLQILFILPSETAIHFLYFPLLLLSKEHQNLDPNLVLGKVGNKWFQCKRSYENVQESENKTWSTYPDKSAFQAKTSVSFVCCTVVCVYVCMCVCVCVCVHVCANVFCLHKRVFYQGQMTNYHHRKTSFLGLNESPWTLLYLLLYSNHIKLSHKQL
jgi:type IV secretory pathway VirB3-like protein